ncbi:alcohol dehydrogenase catalytic domain-containing protein, partial [Verminephrobacter eiseniae]|uniref:alcohol dehydrogenase catalytic domain-containing protein n=1 Tax=Verminephrobacter eiseniae TaxID=364317 RepID=UPI0022443258
MRLWPRAPAARPGPRPFHARRAGPELVAGEVLLKIDAVGICGSDLHAWHGHDPRRKPGLVLGH